LKRKYFQWIGKREKIYIYFKKFTHSQERVVRRRKLKYPPPNHV